MSKKKWSPPIDGCFTVPKRAPDAPPVHNKFDRLIMPIIRPPWYRRLWRWLTKPFRRRPLSLREVLAQNSMKRK